MKKCLVLFLIVVCLSMTGCLSRFSFYLDDLSTDEVGSLLEKYLKTLPEAGNKPEEFSTEFNNKPISFDFGPDNSDDCLTFKFYKDEKSIPLKDALTKVRLSGVYSQMDGSMGLQEDIVIGVYCVIYDYDRAANLYNRLYEFLSPYYFCVEDNRETTSWQAQGLFVSRGIKAGSPCSFVTLDRRDDHYELRGTLWNCLIDEESKTEIEKELTNSYLQARRNMES